MTDWEAAPSLSLDTTPVADEQETDIHRTQERDDALLELRGVFYAPIAAEEVDELPQEARANAIAVVPTQLIGGFINKRNKVLSREAKTVSQARPTVVSSSEERIDYANKTSLIGGQKLAYRELLEFLLTEADSTLPDLYDVAEELK